MLHYLLHGTYCVLLEDFLAVTEIITRVGTAEGQAK